jgi:hypothetical protein
MRLRELGRCSALALGVGLVGLVSASSAGAATQIGETFVPSAHCDTGFTNVQATSPGGRYTVPSNGVITSWSYQSSPTATQVNFKVLRSAGGSSFTVVGESGVLLTVPNQLLTQQIRIPVNAGDVLGVFTNNALCGRVAVGMGYQGFYRPSDQALGTTNTYSGPAQYQLDVAGTLEPDCDNDGFGDESQDQNLVACPPGPSSTITSGPADKVKSKKNRSTATFTFVADEPGATLDCTLDGKQQFEPCVSPVTVTVKKGEHTFSVQATDAGGNQGPAATDTWKVKRKKKK